MAFSQGSVFRDGVGFWGPLFVLDLEEVEVKNGNVEVRKAHSHKKRTVKLKKCQI